MTINDDPVIEQRMGVPSKLRCDVEVEHVGGQNVEKMTQNVEFT
jgi:hypothetical protein